MSFWWIACWLLATNTANDTRVSYPMETTTLTPGLRLFRKPRTLVLIRDKEIVDQLSLPGEPKLARRKDDHAVLALGKHGLWMIRITPEGRLIVVARHRLHSPVDGFFFDEARVVPTATGSPILVKPQIRFNPPPGDSPVLPVGERLRALSNDMLARMRHWPESRDLGPPVSARPRMFLESNFFMVIPFPALTRDVDTGHRLELVVLRVGCHLFPNHVLGTSLTVNLRENPLYPKNPQERYVLLDYDNTKSFFFYRYSLPNRRLEFHVEPLRAGIWDSEIKSWTRDDVWGVRLGVAWVKRTGPLRVGVEGRFDVFERVIMPSVSMIFGFNF